MIFFLIILAFLCQIGLREGKGRSRQSLLYSEYAHVHAVSSFSKTNSNMFWEGYLATISRLVLDNNWYVRSTSRSERCYNVPNTY